MFHHECDEAPVDSFLRGQLRDHLPRAVFDGVHCVRFGDVVLDDCRRWPLLERCLKILVDEVRPCAFDH